MRSTRASWVFTVALIAAGGCAEPEPDSLGCAEPDEPIPGPVVSSIGTGPQHFESQCTLVEVSLVEGTASIELDCQDLPLSIEIPTTRSPSLVGASVQVELDSSGDRFELRLRDDLGISLIILQGAINPGTEGPLSWQLEHACGRASGTVAAHLVVRDVGSGEERRVDVGEVEELEVELELDDPLDPRRRFELRTYLARFELDPDGDAGFASVAMVRSD